MTPIMRMRTVAKMGRLTLIFASHCMVRISLGKLFAIRRATRL
jgi:hypothetical protein